MHFANLKTHIFSLLVLYVCCLNTQAIAQAGKGSGKELIFKGNKFAMRSNTLKDTADITDPVTGKTIIKIAGHEPVPVTMNEEKIYNSNEVMTSQQSKIKRSVVDYIISKIKKDSRVTALPDGKLKVRISDLVINKEGKIVYYNDHYNVIQYRDKNNVRTLPQIIDKYLNDAQPVAPVVAEGQNVPYLINTFVVDYKIQLVDHVVIVSN